MQAQRPAGDLQSFALPHFPTGAQRWRRGTQRPSCAHPKLSSAPRPAASPRTAAAPHGRERRGREAGWGRAAVGRAGGRGEGSKGKEKRAKRSGGAGIKEPRALCKQLQRGQTRDATPRNSGASPALPSPRSTHCSPPPTSIPASPPPQHRP